VDQDSPTVSVIIPALSAAETLPDTLRAIGAQDYRHIVDVIVATGDSGSAEAAERHGALVVDNPDRTTPAALNRAIEASRGEVIVRCDAHATLPPGYVSRAVRTLLRTGADNVGGMQVPEGSTFWERAIAEAMRLPLGAGYARYRVGGKEGPAETVYLGVFRRSTLERLGGFDERFTRTQDYEMNHRIRASGGLVWFDPELRVLYRPRATVAALAKQYSGYGRSKRRFARRHPGALKLRQTAPPLMVVTLVAGLVGGLWVRPLLAIPLAYLLTVVGSGLTVVPRAGLAAVGVPLALAVMHISWGIGFLFPGKTAVVGKDRVLGPSEGGANPADT
jgi:succinoglycan biosynthesis protein ExoA